MKLNNEVIRMLLNNIQLKIKAKMPKVIIEYG